MMSLAEIFRTGGPAMYAVLLLNLLGGLLTLVMGIVGMFGKRVPLPLWLLMPSTVVAVGVAGMMYGISELEQAMAYATPATRSLLYIRGLSMAAAPLLFACMSAAVLLGLSAAAAGAGALTKVGTRAWTPLSAAGATLGCVVAIGVILAGGAMGNIGGSIFPGILVLMFVALGSLLANLSTGDEEVQARITSIRFGVTFMGALAAFCWGVGAHHIILTDVFNAVEMATPETRMKLLGRGLEGSRSALLLGMGSAAVVMLTGVLSNATRLPKACDTRGIVGAVIGLLFASVMLGANSIHSVLAEKGREAAIPTVALEAASKASLPASPKEGNFAHTINPSCLVQLEGKKWVLESGWSEGQQDGCSSEKSDPSGLEDRFVHLEVGEDGDEKSNASEQGCPSSSGPLDGPLCSKIDATLVLDAKQPITPFLLHPWAQTERDFILLLDANSTNGLKESVIADALRWSAHDGMPLTWRRLQPRSPDSRGGAITVVRRTDKGWRMRTLADGETEFGEDGLKNAIARAGITSEKNIALLPESDWSVERTVEVCAELIKEIPREDRRSYIYSEPLALSCPLLSANASELDEYFKPSRDGAGTLEGIGADSAHALGNNPSKVKASTSGGSPTVMGSLDKEVIRRVVRANSNQVRFCYEKELKKNPKLAGTVKVKFAIASNGSVASAAVTSSTLNNSAVESCLTGRIRRWKFPEPKGGGIVLVNYPFSFKAN
jgi:TonB family protein